MSPQEHPIGWPQNCSKRSSEYSELRCLSICIILYEVYSRKEPYDGVNKAQDLREVCDPNINKRPPVPTTMPPAVALLMRDCLTSVPEERPTS
jgi:hypothetical protein